MRGCLSNHIGQLILAQFLHYCLNDFLVSTGEGKGGDGRGRGRERTGGGEWHTQQHIPNTHLQTYFLWQLVRTNVGFCSGGEGQEAV